MALDGMAVRKSAVPVHGNGDGNGNGNGNGNDTGNVNGDGKSGLIVPAGAPGMVIA